MLRLCVLVVAFLMWLMPAAAWAQPPGARALRAVLVSRLHDSSRAPRWLQLQAPAKPEQASGVYDTLERIANLEFLSATVVRSNPNPHGSSASLRVKPMTVGLHAYGLMAVGTFN